MKGLFEMANDNTLLALAYIRESENPLAVFCNLILYCLSKSTNQELRHDELKNKMIETFGLTIPNHVINSCVSYLTNNKFIVKLQFGAGYKLLDSKFDINKFETEKNALADAENMLIADLVEFVSQKFELVWTKEEAHKHFSDLMLKDDTASNVLNGSFFEKSDKPLKYIHPTWYVKKYVISLMEKGEGSCYMYFLNIFNGTLVLNGLIQTNDYSQDKRQKFKGTEFYFDTKILLRLMGFTFPYLHETTKELIDLIKREYDGKVCVFEHVIREMKAVIAFAEQDMQNKGHVDNFEFEYFRKSHNYTADDFRIEKDSVKEKLKNEYDFTVINDIDWGAKKTADNNIDIEQFVEFLKKRNPTWKVSTIRNDAMSVLQTNIRRNGKYSIYFGGKRKLPIFVTTNTKLVFDVREYAEENTHSDNYVCSWTNSILPLITERNLACRLWLTSKRTEAITLNLAKAAFLFQQSDSAFYEKIKETYNEVREKHKYNVVDLDYERFEKLKENIISKTKGDLDAIDENVVAISFEELAERRSEEKDKTIGLLSEQNSIKDKNLNEMEINFIESCAKRYANNVCWVKKLIKVAIKQLPAILAVSGVLISWLLDYIITDEILSTGKLFAIIPIAISVVFSIIDKNLPESLIDKLIYKYKTHCKKKYEESLKNEFSTVEKPFEEEILKETIKLTKFFN